MIKRQYFYQVESMAIDSKFAWGILTVKSWLPEPWIATKQILSDFKENTGATDRQVKIITFNRV